MKKRDPAADQRAAIDELQRQRDAVEARIRRRLEDPDTQAGNYQVNAAGQLRPAHYHNAKTRAAHIDFLEALLADDPARIAATVQELRTARYVISMFMTGLRQKPDGRIIVPRWRERPQKADDAAAARWRRRTQPWRHLQAAARWREANREYKRAADRLYQRLNAEKINARRRRARQRRFPE